MWASGPVGHGSEQFGSTGFAELTQWVPEFPQLGLRTLSKVIERMVRRRVGLDDIPDDRLCRNNHRLR